MAEATPFSRLVRVESLPREGQVVTIEAIDFDSPGIDGNQMA